ncbi:MAG TPA: glycosyltransferase family 39 protein [Dehalococcoidia bacterium]|nr:glycosyltransferase family 39 protein [Dehalococcoidia bacterium]
MKASITGWEVASFTVLFLTGTALRCYDLAGYPSGIHGDEAVFGLIAERILKGAGPHVFGTEFLSSPAIYMYTEAPFLWLFGHSIEALRLYSAIVGVLTLPAYYLLVRGLHGVRTALLALTLLTASAVHINFSRLALNVIQVPLLTCLVFIAIRQGMARRAPFWWLAAGMLGGLATYFHFSGRLVPLLIGAYFVYLGLAHRRDWRVWLTGACLTLLGGATAVAPFVIHSAISGTPLTDHEANRLIFSDWARVTAANQSADPVTVLWNQLSANLLIFISGVDRSQFFTFADTPMAPPLIGPLVIFGLVVLHLRIHDDRYALWNVWFWLVVLLGGALTLDSPQVHRLLVALLPVITGTALVLGAIIDLCRRLAGPVMAQPLLVAAALVPIVAGAVDVANYFGPAAAASPWAQSTAQAQFISKLGSTSRAYTLGAPAIYFNHEVTRFLAPNVEGDSLNSPGARLPLAVPADRDLTFLIYPQMEAYRAVVQETYPVGEAGEVTGRDGHPIFTTWRVPRSEVARRQGLTERIDGVERIETDVAALGAGATNQPALATWTGSLHADQSGPHRLLLEGGTGEILIDGQLLGPSGARDLAVGWHALEVRARLAGPDSRLSLKWQPPRGSLEVIPVSRLDARAVAPVRGRPVTGAAPADDRRDATIGFRDVTSLFSGGPARTVRWEATLQVAEPGRYELGVSSAGKTDLVLDGRTIVAADDAGASGLPQTRPIDLTSGPHVLSVTYEWQQGTGRLEEYWRRPGGPPEIIPPAALQPPAGR